MKIPDLENGSQLLTSREAAALLRIGTRSLYEISSPRGSLPCVRIGRSVRYSQAAVEEWIEQQQTVTTRVLESERIR